MRKLKKNNPLKTKIVLIFENHFYQLGVFCLQVYMPLQIDQHFQKIIQTRQPIKDDDIDCQRLRNKEWKVDIRMQPKSYKQIQITINDGNDYCDGNRTQKNLF